MIFSTFSLTGDFQCATILVNFMRPKQYEQESSLRKAIQKA